MQRTIPAPAARVALRGVFRSALTLVAFCVPATGLSALGCSPEAKEGAPSARPAGGGASAPAAPARPAVAVQIQEVTPRRFEFAIPATGTLLPAESTNIVAELSRRLVKVHAVEGARVKKGDVLFQLDSSELRAQVALLTVRETLAKKTAERAAALVAERVGTEAEKEVAEASVEELRAERHALSVMLDKTTIRAPYDGILGLRNVSEGAWVTPETALIGIADTSKLKLDFQIPERYVGSVQIGGAFTVKVAGRSVALSGRITAMEPEVNATTRSLTVRGLVEPAGAEEVRPGSFAKVELPVVVEDALLVPAIVISPGADGQAVFIEENGRAKRVVLELGARGPELLQVLSGLSPGDRLITSNLLRLKDGEAVSVEPGG